MGFLLSSVWHVAKLALLVKNAPLGAFDGHPYPLQKSGGQKKIQLLK
jgi:hypothetical protein